MDSFIHSFIHSHSDFDSVAFPFPFRCIPIPLHSHCVSFRCIALRRGMEGFVEGRMEGFIDIFIYTCSYIKV